ncbi:MAG: GNAT family N-acetyltransferase [Conexibacter sp.]
MTSALRIRAAAAADVPTLLELIAELAAYERRAHHMHASEALLARHLFGERPSAEALLAEVEGQPTGYAVFFETFSTFAGRPGIWLEDLFVRPARRRAGIGRALLVRVAADATARGCAHLEWSALDWNEPALSFYRSLGAQARAEWIPHRIEGADLQRLAAG